ncbi:hypothetical protein [Chroococcidiopsis sp.]|uniref:hypothetical protein n=1 Tax=Chroococcidiopsis sp. TaxID=3088168 RepID=UPI003F355466
MSILETAVKRVIAKLEYKAKKGHFTDGDAWILGYLEEALKLHESIENPLEPLSLKHDCNDIPTAPQKNTSASHNDSY